MNDAIEKALLTWYPKDNELHMDPLHPAIKLAGEAGEILDLYGKHRFKPGFSWWDCKHCKEPERTHSDTGHCVLIDEPVGNKQYVPMVLDELGDWWYYCRILCYQSDIDFSEVQSDLIDIRDVSYHLAWMNFYSATVFKLFMIRNEIDVWYLRNSYVHFLCVLDNLDVILDQITKLNYIKLNTDKTNHGWAGANE